MFNVFDIGIILILIMFVIVGFKRGVIKECVSLVGIIIIFVLAFSLKGFLGNILCQCLPFLTFKGSIEGMVTINILLYQVIAFLIVFCLLLSVYSIALFLSKIIQKVVNLTIILLIPSKILGGFVSLIKGYIILFVVLLFLMIPLGNTSIFQNSTIIHFMMHKTPVISSYTGNFIKPIQEVYSLGEKVSKKKISVNEANLASLDIMLKYKVVDKETIVELKQSGKLDDIEDIDSILKKY